MVMSYFIWLREYILTVLWITLPDHTSCSWVKQSINRSRFAFYCTKPFLFSDRSPESNQARLTHALQLSHHLSPLTTRMVITVEPSLIRTAGCLVPRLLSFDENVRAKEGGKETTGFACRLYPSHGPLRFITSHSRFALASAKRKTKRLRRRLDTSLLRAVYLVPGKRKPLHFLLIQPVFKIRRDNGHLCLAQSTDFRRKPTTV